MFFPTHKFARLSAVLCLAYSLVTVQGQSTGQSQQSPTPTKPAPQGGKGPGGGDGNNKPAPEPAQKPYKDSSGQNFSLDNLPKQWQDNQSGTNQCKQWGASSQDSMCQNAFINGVSDFCLWAPPEVGIIGDTERIEVSWCLKPGYGTRLIPEGTFTAAHFVKTSAYVQVTGAGDLTKLNIPKGDTGGELDPHGADGNGNPIGGLVFTSAFGGQYQQIHEWTNFMSDAEFCFRACIGETDQAKAQCQHIYDTMGCHWNMPANYNPGFDECQGEVGEPMGVYNGVTFHQGDAVTPDAHSPPKTSDCKNVDALNYAYTMPSAPAPTPETPGTPSNQSHPPPTRPHTNGTTPSKGPSSGVATASALDMTLLQSGALVACLLVAVFAFY